MITNPFELSGKTILVTGASSGIGCAVAVLCAQMGACVIINGRNEQKLNQTLAMLKGEGHSLISADLSDENQITQLASAISAVDGVVHSAGLIKTVPFSFTNTELLDEVMGVNFTAPTILSSLLTKQKKINKGGSIVFISSISGVLCGGIGSSVYSASKGAINGLVKSMALDMAPKGIRVNTVNPGMIDTAFLDEGVISQQQLDEDKKRYPLKRYGTPEEVAYAVLYFLSDTSRWTTGTSLVVDGGYTLN